MVDIAAERARALAHLYDAYGSDAEFTPSGGSSSTTVKVRPLRPRETTDLGAVGVMVEKRQLRVRVSEIGIASPRGGTLVFAGETLRIKQAPLDPHRLEFTLGCAEIASS